MDANGQARSASPASPSALIDSLSGLSLDAGDSSQHSIITVDGAVTSSESQNSIAGPAPDAATIARSLDEAQAAIKAVTSHIFSMEEKMHTGGFLTDAADASAPSSPTQRKDGQDHVSQASDRETAFIKLDELLEQASRSMRSAQSGLEAKEKEEAEGGDEDEENGRALAAKQRERRGSLSSLSSFTSFDDGFPAFDSAGDIAAISLSALRKRYDEACTAWTAAHGDADKLKAELLDTQYVRVFKRNALEIDEHYESLLRAVEAANTLVYRANEQRVNSSISRGRGAGAVADDDDKEVFQGLLSETTKLQQTINVKRQYYLNSDEQLLVIMERSIAERANPNGAIVRQLEDLQTRHKGIKDSLKRAEKSLERTQGELEEMLGLTNSDQGSTARTSSDSGVGRGSTSAPSKFSTPTRPPVVRPKSSRRTAGNNSTPSPGSSHKGLSPTNTLSPPVKPLKSPHRISTTPGDTSYGSSISSSGTPRRAFPSSSTASLNHARSFSASVQSYNSTRSPASARLDSKRSSRNLGAGSVTPLGYSGSPSSRPAWNSSRVITRDEEEEEERQQYLRKEAQRVESQRLRGYSYGIGTALRRGSGASSTHPPLPSTGRSVSGSAPRWSPERPFRAMSPSAPPTSYRAPSTGDSSYSYPRRSKTPQPQPTWTRAGSEPPQSGPARPLSRTEAASANPPAHTAPLRPGSSLAFHRSSAAESASPSRIAPHVSRNGTYYRPPTETVLASEDKKKKRESLIPRLAFSHDGPSSPERAGLSRVPRPSSALSQNSSVSAISAISSGPPAASFYKSASRLSMQTPEPQIAARATRMSMFARPSGKPPPARSTASNASSGLSNGLRRSTAGSGRATPLSAAALAAVPHASVLPPRAGAGSVTGGVGSASSVQNFRAAQMAAAGGARAGSHYSPATSRDGANTPTLSEGGASSVGAHSAYTYGGSSYGMRRSVGHPRDLALRHVSRDSTGTAGGRLDLYRPNPHDVLDVEVAAIVNREGASLEMVDPPLPKGFKREVGPGKDCQARYNIAGKVVACRLLELHPAGSTLRGTQPAKKRKIQVRVGGGWQELESWLLSRLGG